MGRCVMIGTHDRVSWTFLLKHPAILISCSSMEVVVTETVAVYLNHASGGAINCHSSPVGFTGFANLNALWLAGSYF